MTDFQLEPPTSPPLTEEQRALCARAIGDDVIAAGREIAKWPFEYSETPIRVVEFGIAADVDSLWVSEQLRQFHLKQLKFANADYSNTKWIGKRLRARATGLLRDASEIASLAAFMHEFGEKSIASLFARWIAASVHSAGILVVLLASDSAEERLTLSRDLNRSWADASKCHVGLKRFAQLVRDAPTEDRDVVVDVANEIFGVAPEVPITTRGNVPRAYRGGPPRWNALSAPQLRLIFPAIWIPDHDADNMITLAMKLGDSELPLLANRVANLVGALLRRAAEADFDATGRLIADFLWKQSGRIVAAGGEYRTHLARFYEEPDRLHILDAYKALTEGVLRPYGSLLMCLRDVTQGSNSGEFAAFDTLGELESSLRGSTDELVRLAEIGLSPALRNERAHENAFIDGAGKAATLVADGTTIEIDLGDVWWRCRILRSFLDGVDVATNVASASISDRSNWKRPETPIPTSLRMLEQVVTVLAGRLTRGSCEGLQVSGHEARITFEGEHREGELRALVAATRPILDPSISRIVIVSTDGDLIYADEPEPLGSE